MTSPINNSVNGTASTTDQPFLSPKFVEGLYTAENLSVLVLQCMAITAFCWLIFSAHFRPASFVNSSGLSAAMQLFVVSNVFGLVTSLPTSLQKVIKVFDPQSQLMWIFWLYAINGVYQRSVATFFVLCLTVERILILGFPVFFIRHRKNYVQASAFLSAFVTALAIYFYTMELPLDPSEALGCYPTICITPKYKLYKQNALKIVFSTANFVASILFLAWLKKKDAGRKIKNRTVKFTIIVEFVFDIIPSVCDYIITLAIGKTVSQLVGPLPLVLINFGLTLCSLYYAAIYLRKPAVRTTVTMLASNSNGDAGQPAAPITNSAARWLSNRIGTQPIVSA